MRGSKRLEITVVVGISIVICVGLLYHCILELLVDGNIVRLDA